MYKIYESNNYIIVEDVNRKETFYGHKKEVFIDKSNLNNPAYRIFKVRDLKEGTLIEIGKIQKEDDSLYTEEEFDTFYRTNTGNFNGGGTAPTGDFIPLAGTENDKPVTGNIIVSGQVAIGGINGSGYISTYFDAENTILTLFRKDPVTENFTTLGLESDSNIYITGTNPEFRGLEGEEDYSDRVTELSYVQKSYVDNKAIPLAGTLPGNPVSGDIEMSDFTRIKALSPSANVFNYIEFDDGSFNFKREDLTSGRNQSFRIKEDGINVNDDYVLSRGLIGIQDFTSNITDLDYTQKIYVDAPSTQTQTQRSTSTSGTDTISFDGRNGIYIHEAGLTTALTINLPVAPVDSQIVTIMSVGGIATLTLATAVGTIIGAVTALTALTSVKFIWLASENKWYRI